MIDDDGYSLWLGYENNGNFNSKIEVFTKSKITDSAISELKRTGNLLNDAKKITLGKFCDLPKNIQKKIKIQFEEKIQLLKSKKKYSDTFCIFCDEINSEKNVIVASSNENAILYGIFALIREIRLGKSLNEIKIFDFPKINLRILNHWDNLDGTIERGYAGNSIWKWDELPKKIDSRYEDYARFCASIGINATVLNNVNTQPQILTGDYIKKISVLAKIFSEWGIKTFISVNFGSPVYLNELKIADPFDKNVILWWKNKAKEIWSQIPDFGGFLVKADSEGQAGPFEYGRTQADGANMLAKAVKPYGGLIIWRAFVYGQGEKDRAKKAYSIFMPHDGDFAKNVVLQVKNGPVDFQPREPVHPLFGAMKKTDLFMEFQITQEYLGQQNHIVFLAPMWKEILDFELNGKNLLENSTDKNNKNNKNYKNESDFETVGNSLSKNKNVSGISGVSNIGNNRNWCGSLFHAANWYAFGRLSWNYELLSEEIAREWAVLTWGKNPEVLQAVLKILLNSWEACVNYMTPLGLHHIMKFSHHYGPDPACDEGEREDWKPKYYHQADESGLGSRRSRTEDGSFACDQYRTEVAEIFSDIKKCPEKYLLWFHHVSWDFVLKSGRTLKEELPALYQKGVNQAEDLEKSWLKIQNQVGKSISKTQFDLVLQKLKIQVENAKEWQEVCCNYFLSFCEPKKNT